MKDEIIILLKFYLDRSPNDDEIQNLIQNYNNLNDIKKYIFNTDEFKTKNKQYFDIYKEVLERKMDINGFENYKKLITQNKINFNNLKNIFRKSDEYINLKVNFIDKIFYLNMKKSKERNKNMIRKLNKTGIKYQRVEAIDTNFYNYRDNVTFSDFKFNVMYKSIIKQKKMTKGEIGCLLSHFYTFHLLKKEKGNYFLILEDDASLKNIQYFKIDLKKIIKNSPEFDILVLYKTCNEELDSRYSSRVDLLKNNKYVAGTVAYIISKEGVKNINKFFYFNKNKFVFRINKRIQPIDILLYSLVKTYFYKFNFISSELNCSTIHKENDYLHEISINFQNDIIKKNKLI